MLRVHHLNCATMHPVGGRRVLGHAGGQMICHCLLVEADRELVLFQATLTHDRRQRRANIERLGELAQDPRRATRIFCAHDPSELAAY